MTDNDWVKSAMDDNNLVVEILFKLRQSSAPPSHTPPPPPLGWTVRQRRSRPQTVLPPPAKKSAAARASPATPLSWSGNTSISGNGAGGDGVEESSRLIHKRSDIVRSKVMPLSETTPTKRPRKKKTLAELKEEEMLLLTERQQLKRQLATLQATCEKQRKENESLKKMKLEVQTQPQEERLDATQQTKAVSLINDGFEAKKDLINEREAIFVLPDLNIPAGEDISA